LETLAFEHVANEEEIGLGDLTLFEVLKGITYPEQYEKVKSHLLKFNVFIMGGKDLILEAITNARRLQVQGIQVATIDCLIATFYLVSGCRLLSADHHFQPFVDKLGLVMVR